MHFKKDLEHSPFTLLLFNLAESSIPRFRRVVCAEVVTNEFFEESCEKYMRFRVFSARTSVCHQRRSARKICPSRCRRVHHSSFVEKAQHSVNSPGLRFLNWLAISSSSERPSKGGERGEDRIQPLVLRQAHAEPTFALPIIHLSKSALDPRDVMSPLSFLSINGASNGVTVATVYLIFDL